VAAVGSSLAVIIFAVWVGHSMSWSVDDRAAVTMFVALLMAALMYGWRTKNLASVQALTLLTLLLLFEVGNESSYMLADRNDWGRRQFIEKVWSNGDLADFLRRQPGPFRVETQTEEIERSWGDFHNIDFPTAYAGVTVNTFNLETHTPQTMKLVGVKYTLARASTRSDQREVFRGASGIAIYENPDVFPRAWAIHEFVPIKTPNDGRAFINSNVQELRSKALITIDTPRNLSCPAAQDSVSVAKYAAERVALEATMSCDGMVVLSDTYYPGWDAKVDGKPAQVYEVDLALRGVIVPAGTHRISFVYRPRSFMLGIALTFAGLMGAVLITIVGRRKGS
jgi:Bacterial membrane protein YfhO